MKGKARYIDTRFWDDNYITALKPLEKLVFLYFLTNPLTNIAGIYEISIGRMLFDLRIPAKEVRRILEKFEASKKIFYVEGWIIVSNFPKYQKAEESPKIKAAIMAIIMNLPQYLLLKIDTLSIPYPYPIHTPSHIDIDIDIDTSNARKRANPPKEEKPRKENPIFSLMVWGEQQRAGQFTSRPKQLTAIKKMKTAKISIDEIKHRWQEMEGDKFWGEKGFDFMDISNTFNKKR